MSENLRNHKFKIFKYISRETGNFEDIFVFTNASVPGVIQCQRNSNDDLCLEKEEILVAKPQPKYIPKIGDRILIDATKDYLVQIYDNMLREDGMDVSNALELAENELMKTRGQGYKAQLIKVTPDMLERIKRRM